MLTNLYKKILAVQQKIDAVPKRGFNSFHKYHYATEADILTIKETLNAQGLIVLPTTAHQETGFKPDGKSWASVTLNFQVVDVESGESLQSQFIGYAEDNFDKAIYKATTGANKYFYLKFFGIATEDDPEREDVAYPKAATSLPRTESRKEGGEINGSYRKPVSATTPTSDQKNKALVTANKILGLQKQAGLSNKDVLRIAEIDSIKNLAEAGNAKILENAYFKLEQHVRLEKAL